MAAGLTTACDFGLVLEHYQPETNGSTHDSARVMRESRQVAQHNGRIEFYLNAAKSDCA
jgi:hypothetical protein